MALGISAAGWVGLAAAGATVYGANKASGAAKDAANTQAASADRALAVFEKNAGLSQNILKDSTNSAIGTVRSGVSGAADKLREGSDSSIATLQAGAGRGIEALAGGAKNAITTLTNSQIHNQANILTAFGLQKDELNSTALTASGVINAAREKAVGAITSGFGDAAAQILSGRDLVNQILQDSTTKATEKLDLAKAGAIAAQDRGLSTIRSDYQPYLDAGRITADQLTKLVNDPQAQKDFITNNPFYDALAKDAETKLLGNQAAKGRTGTGSTQAELHNKLILLGNDLLDTTINQRLNLVGVGMNAAGQVAGAETNRANTVSGIEESTGKSLADLAAQLGVNQGNNTSNAAKSLADLSVEQGKQIASTETGAGKDLATIEGNRGTAMTGAIDAGINRLTEVNSNVDNNIATVQNELGTNTGNMINNAGQNIATIQNQTGTNQANLTTAATDAEAKLQSNLGINQSNILTNQAANTADTLVGQGDAQAAGIVGSANAVNAGLTGVAKLIAANAPETEAEKAAKKKAAGG